MKKENNKWYIGWIFFPAWYLIGDIKQIRQYDIKSFAVIVLFTILAGIAFCLVYIKRGNVVFGIAAHMSINLMHNLMYLVNQ